MTARHSLDQIVRGLDGVTPGPWRTFNGTDVYPDDDDKEGMRHIADCDMEGSIGGDEQRANAAHIARCSPDTIREIAAYVRDLEERLAKAAEALEPFAKEADIYDPPNGDDAHAAWSGDFPIGSLRRARTALRDAGGGE